MFTTTFTSDVTGPCPEPEESSPHPHVLFIKIHFNMEENI